MPRFFIKIADVKQDALALVHEAAEVQRVVTLPKPKAHGIGEGEDGDAPQVGLNVLRSLALIPLVIAVVEKLMGWGMGAAIKQLLAIVTVCQKAGACGYGKAVLRKHHRAVLEDVFKLRGSAAIKGWP